MGARGLNRDGTISREGSLSRVSPEFAPVVGGALSLVSEVFGGDRLHSCYLYGSLPRGTAVPGVSDLDLLLVLHDEPNDVDRADAATVEVALDQTFSQVNGVGILLFSARRLLSELERHDLGFFVACLCTPLLGDDLAEHLPAYRPTSLLARETNGDLSRRLDRWRAELSQTQGLDRRPLLCRAASRKIVRSGFTLVMPRWRGWTSDLAEASQVFGRYYPHRAAQMALAATIGRAPSADPGVLHMLLEDLGPWLAAEYTAVHGVKTPRPDEGQEHRA